MGTNSRVLSVRFVGDAAALQGTFKEVSAGAAAAGAGLHSTGTSAEDVGKSFTKTGKIVKGTAKAFKSSGLDAASAGASFLSAVPALSGVASGAGMALVQAESLGTVLSGLGGSAAGAFPAVAALTGAVVLAGAAYAIFHDRVGAATTALQLQTAANEANAKSHKETAKANVQAVNDTRSASLSHQQALLSLAQANQQLLDLQKQGGKGSVAYSKALLDQEAATKKVATAEKEHGKSSVEYRRALFDQEQATRKVAEAEKAGGKDTLEYRAALLAQKQAQEAVRTSRQDLIHQGERAIGQSKASAKAIDDEIASTHKAANEARGRQQMIRLGLIQGKDVAAAQKEINKALAAEARASDLAGAKHRANAARTKALADAIGTATPRAKALHDRLMELSRTELNMANAIGAMHALRDAADAAAGGIAHVISLLSNQPSTPSWLTNPGGGGGGGKKPPGGRSGASGASDSEWTGGQTEQGWPGAGKTAAAARAAHPAAAAAALFRPLRGDIRGTTISDRTDAAIAARHRDDSLQDKRVGAAAAAKAKKRGVTNPDKLQEISDLAVLKVRKAEVIKDIAAVRKGLKKVVGAIGKARTKLAKQRASRRKAKKDDQSKLDSAISTTISQIQGLWDQHRALLREGNELVAEARELGYDIKQLDTELKTLPDAAPADTAGDAGGDTGPTEADSIDAAIAQAALTPGTEDDKAAADAAIAYWQREYAAALASGDPRRETAAAQGLKQAQDNRQALDDNTAALNANTDAINQAFGGSTVFSYRGQDYGLRTIAPPSSDRLTGTEVLL